MMKILSLIIAYILISHYSYSNNLKNDTLYVYQADQSSKHLDKAYLPAGKNLLINFIVKYDFSAYGFAQHSLMFSQLRKPDDKERLYWELPLKSLKRYRYITIKNFADSIQNNLFVNRMDKSTLILIIRNRCEKRLEFSNVKFFSPRRDLE